MTKNLSRREFLRLAGVGTGAAVVAAGLPNLAFAQDVNGVPGVESGVAELQFRETGTQRAPNMESVRDTLQSMYPDTEWNLVYDMSNWTSLRPRFLAGDPPDAAWLSVEGNPWGLLDEGLLADLTPLMEAPAYGQEDITFAESFLPGLLEPGQKDGVQYLLPHSINTWGLWYNAALFDEKGWSVPEVLGEWQWDDFKALAEQIKGEGLYAVLAGGPGNAGTFWWAFYLNFVYQIGGDEQLNAMDSLTPGIWNNDVIITALERAKELFDEEIIDPTWSAIDWGDATTLSLQDKVAFNPDGQWHVGSNKDRLPEGYQMAFAPTPTIPDVQGSPSLIQANAEPALFVPKEAKMPRAGMEYLRLWDSLPVSVERLEVAGDMVPIKGAGEGASIHPATASMLSYFNQAERYYNPMFHVWYAPLRDATNAAFTDMALGNISPQEAADKFEEAAQSVRDDGTITIHQRG